MKRKPLKDLLEEWDHGMMQIPAATQKDADARGEASRSGKEMARRLRKLDEKCKNASAVAYDPHSETTPLILKVSEVRSILDGEE